MQNSFDPPEEFAPEETGSSLPLDMFSDWVALCNAVKAEAPAIYNTWFENRHGRARGWEHWRIRAEQQGRAIIVWCPHAVWKEKFRDEALPVCKRHTKRYLIVLRRGERKPTRRDLLNEKGVTEKALMSIKPGQPAARDLGILGRSIIDRIDAQLGQ